MCGDVFVRGSVCVCECVCMFVGVRACGRGGGLGRCVYGCDEYLINRPIVIPSLHWPSI